MKITNEQSQIHQSDKTLWRIGPDKKGSYCNLEPCLYDGLSDMDVRLFRKLNKDELACNSNREKLLTDFCHALKDKQYSISTQQSIAGNLKRWIKWVDSKRLSVTESNAAELFISYLLEKKREGSTGQLINLLLEITPLTGKQRQSMITHFRATAPSYDDYVIKAENRILDFKRFFIPGDAIDNQEWNSFTEDRKTKGLTSKTLRAVFIEEVIKVFRHKQLSAQWSHASLVTGFLALRKWIIWLDGKRHQISLMNCTELLSEYSRYLQGLVAGKMLMPKTVYHRLNFLYVIIADTLDTDAIKIKAKLLFPVLSESGLYSKPESSDDVQRFCAFLHGFIASITVEVIQSELSESKTITAGPYHVKLPGQDVSYINTHVPFNVRNYLIARLRIQAEMLRFIAVTGANLQVALNLTIGDWKNRSSDNLSSYKARANHSVELRINKQYKIYLDRHIQFLEKALPIKPDGNTPLFPSVHFNATHRTIAASYINGRVRPVVKKLGHTSSGYFNKLLDAQDIPRLTSRLLRKAKAQWLLRRYKGDSLATSRALGNTPAITFSHYGGKGNLVISEREWSSFWESNQTLQSSLAPGLCESPSIFRPLSTKAPERTCMDAATCLHCKHYRGENSLDYIQRLLSFNYTLQKRARANPLIDESNTIVMTIVDKFVSLNPHLKIQVNNLRAQISDGQSFHPRFASIIKIHELLTSDA